MRENVQYGTRKNNRVEINNVDYNQQRDNIAEAPLSF